MEGQATIAIDIDVPAHVGHLQEWRAPGAGLDKALPQTKVRSRHAYLSNGSTTLDVRLVLKTDDDAVIVMTYRGVRHGSTDVITRMERGEAVDPERYYFRINPLFETAVTTYDWLNRILAVGIAHRRPDGPVYSVFEVL